VEKEKKRKRETEKKRKGETEKKRERKVAAMLSNWESESMDLLCSGCP